MWNTIFTVAGIFLAICIFLFLGHCKALNYLSGCREKEKQADDDLFDEAAIYH